QPRPGRRLGRHRPGDQRSDGRTVPARGAERHAVGLAARGLPHRLRSSGGRRPALEGRLAPLPARRRREPGDQRRPLRVLVDRAQDRRVGPGAGGGTGAEALRRSRLLAATRRHVVQRRHRRPPRGAARSPRSGARRLRRLHRARAAGDLARPLREPAVRPAPAGGEPDRAAQVGPPGWALGVPRRPPSLGRRPDAGSELHVLLRLGARRQRAAPVPDRHADRAALRLVRGVPRLRPRGPRSRAPAGRRRRRQARHPAPARREPRKLQRRLRLGPRGAGERHHLRSGLPRAPARVPPVRERHGPPPPPLVRAAPVLRVRAGVTLLGARTRLAQPAVGNFVVETNPFLLGQASDWVDERHVVWHDPIIRDEDGDGQTHIYRSTLDGTEKVCLTCGLDGPNQVPVVQPHGRWILFHSWNGHSVRIGAPGFGGLGSDVWVMTREGTHRTNLTKSSELRDNFHAYWSPDGRYLVWTALSWNSDEGGNGRSDIRVARFDPHGPAAPRLVDAHLI